MMRPYVGSWKRLAVHGVAAVFFGLATLVWPGITLWALVLLWGAFALRRRRHRAVGRDRRRLLVHRGWVAFWGVTGIGAGIVTFMWPSMTALALLVVIATWALLIGGSRIAFAITARKQVSGAWSIALGGVLLVLLGVLLVVNPGDRGDRHHLGDRVARLPVRQRRAVACVEVRRETHEAGRTDARQPLPQPDTR